MAVWLLHTADVPLGRAFGDVGERAPAHRQRLLRAFEKAIETAHQQGCDAMLIAGDLDERGELTQERIARSQLDYIALGDWHSPQDFSVGGVACWYSGAPEMILPDQQLPGRVLIVEPVNQGKGLRSGGYASLPHI